MNNIEFIVGPPGTGKTHIYLKQKYQELLQNGFEPQNIICLSHTNVAAEEITEAVKELPEIKVKNLDEDFFDYKIGTIHSYCQSKLNKKSLFDEQDHLNLCREHKEFRYDPEKNVDEHEFYKIVKSAKGFGLGNQIRDFHFPRRHDFKFYKDTSVVEDMYEWFMDYKDREYVRSYEDMIEEFNDENVKEPLIDVLIVDEAQDSNDPQRKALEKIATHAKKFIMIGDPDQTIFEWAGANADYFHRISRDAKDLEQGRRCGKTINELCKKIISPVWKHYRYNRTWKPVEGIIGKHHHLPDYTSNCSARIALLDKIKNTNESFLFTFRGKPSHKWIKKFLMSNGINFSHVGNDPFVSQKKFFSHKTWPEFVKGKPVSLKQIKHYWEFMGTKAIVYGKKTEKFKDWIDREYTAQELIEKGFLRPESINFIDFTDVRIPSEVKKEEEKIRWIKDLIRNGIDIKDDNRIQYGNIHQVKGLTFDNVIVDLTMVRKEDYFTQLRLKYVAYSRGRIDCWTIASQDDYTLGERQ